jgi:hypothetical protein
MPDTIENLCRIPGGDESQDPCGDNPFPVEDARHEVWDKATRKAEEELSWLKVELLKRRPNNFQDVINFVLDLRIGWFHIWAKRGVHVVWGEFNIAPYDNWLRECAESVLKLFSERYPGEIGALTELRAVLYQGVEYWKAESRRYVSQQPPEMHLGDEAFSKSDQGSALEPSGEESLEKVRITQAREVERNRLERKTRAEALTREPETLLDTNPSGTTELKPDESSGKDSEPTANAADPGGTGRKGDFTLLEGKEVVSFKTAETYLGITERQRQNLMKAGSLTVRGQGMNRKITSESLLKYLPPENPKRSETIRNDPNCKPFFFCRLAAISEA